MLTYVRHHVPRQREVHVPATQVTPVVHKCILAEECLLYPGFLCARHHLVPHRYLLKMSGRHAKRAYSQRNLPKYFDSSEQLPHLVPHVAFGLVDDLDISKELLRVPAEAGGQITLHLKRQNGLEGEARRRRVRFRNDYRRERRNGRKWRRDVVSVSLASSKSGTGVPANNLPRRFRPAA